MKITEEMFSAAWDAYYQMYGHDDDPKSLKCVIDAIAPLIIEECAQVIERYALDKSPGAAGFALAIRELKDD